MESTNRGRGRPRGTEEGRESIGTIRLDPEEIAWLKAQGRPASKTISKLIRDRIAADHREAELRRRKVFRFWQVKPADVADEAIQMAIVDALNDLAELQVYQVHVEGDERTIYALRLTEAGRVGFFTDNQAEWFFSRRGIEREIDAWLNGTELLAMV